MASFFNSISQSVNNLGKPPTEVKCAGCPLVIPVPATAWDWTCDNRHLNNKDAKVCSVCNIPKPKSFQPVVICPQCHTQTPIPSNNAVKFFKDAATSTKTAVVGAAVATKESISKLGSTPTQFHCEHCDALLAVPSGPWACQTCTFVNAEDQQKCNQCSQSKADQKAICGVCRQSTCIPSSNFTDSVHHTFRSASKSTKKVFYDVSGKPYVVCPRCSGHVPVPNPPAVNQAEMDQKMAQMAAAPQPEQGSHVGAPGSIPSAEVLQPGLPPQVTCPQCNNKIDVAPRPQ